MQKRSQKYLKIFQISYIKRELPNRKSLIYFGFLVVIYVHIIAYEFKFYKC